MFVKFAAKLLLFFHIRKFFLKKNSRNNLRNLRSLLLFQLFVVVLWGVHRVKNATITGPRPENDLTKPIPTPSVYISVTHLVSLLSLCINSRTHLVRITDDSVRSFSGFLSMSVVPDRIRLPWRTADGRTPYFINSHTRGCVYFTERVSACPPGLPVSLNIPIRID